MLSFNLDTSSAVTTIASQGLLGAMLVVVGLYAWTKDKQLQDERLARINDAKSYNDLALKLQAQVLDAVNKLADILDEMKKFMTAPQAPAPRRGSFGSG